MSNLEQPPRFPLKSNSGRFSHPITTLMLATLSLLSSLPNQAQLYGEEKHIPPNIVLMMADDMGMGDTSAYSDFTGNADDVQVHTPNMQRLAQMGVRFTDAHTPSSRCSTTRYGLLTGRYSWRNRLKFWVLFGSQGDPMIEADRPTLASMLSEQNYRTAMFGKWHVGLRYRRSDGSPAAAWADADLTQPLHTSPIDHGFDVAKFTSRSHGTSGPNAGAKNAAKRNGPNQSSGPGHIDGRRVIGATDNGKQLVAKGPKAYVLDKLGSRHCDHAIEFLTDHVAQAKTKERPFFLYYPANSNHGPYTPDVAIGGKLVKGAARTKSGKPMDARHDYIYENDVVLGRLLDWLEATDDPRRTGKKLIDNTLVIFTSDNGAEKNSNIATGPFRSNKGSIYEGGHRVPFLATWPAGRVGDGDATTAGSSNSAPIGLQDLYATFAEIVGAKLPDLRAGEKGAEDSYSILAALRGEPLPGRPPLMVNDHRDATGDNAWVALRLDSPTVDGQAYPGQWKLLFDASLLRAGTANPRELYNLAEDQREQTNLLGQAKLAPLVEHLTQVALLHRNSGGHRMVSFAPPSTVTLDFKAGSQLAKLLGSQAVGSVTLKAPKSNLKVHLSAHRGPPAHRATPKLHVNEVGLGITGGQSPKVNASEAILLKFDRDVLVESAALVAGTDGTCGGFYRMGEGAPLAIYCVDADIDAKDQSGILSDLGVLPAGQTLRLDSSPHFKNEAAGAWQLRNLRVRVLPE